MGVRESAAVRAATVRQRPTANRKCNTLLFLGLPFPDTVKLRSRAQEDTVPDHRGGRQAHLVQAVLGEYLELRPGLDDIGVAVLAEAKDLAVIGPGGGREGRCPVLDSLFVVDFLAGSGVVTTQETPVMEDVQ